MRRIIALIFVCVFSLSSCEGLPVEIVITFIPANTLTPTLDILESETPVEEPTTQPTEIESTPSPVNEDPLPSVEPTNTVKPSSYPDFNVNQCTKCYPYKYIHQNKCSNIDLYKHSNTNLYTNNCKLAVSNSAGITGLHTKFRKP